MARDVMVHHFEPGKGWVLGEIDPEDKAMALKQLAEAQAQLEGLGEEQDGERVKLRRRVRDLHKSVPQEVSVEYGRASVKTVEEGDRNATVHLRPDHLTDPILGHLDMMDSALWASLGEVRRTGGRCRYRIVTWRTPGVDPALPWDRVPDRRRIRDLVGVEVLGPASAAPGNSAGGATGDEPSPAGANSGELLCPLCDKPTAGQGPIRKHEATGRFAHEACWKADRAHQQEAPPVPVRNSGQVPTDRPDLRSLMDAAMGTVGVAVDLLVAQPEPATLGKVRSLSFRLDDAVQVALRTVGASAEHRARAALRIAVKVVPPPWGRPDSYGAWVTALGQMIADIATLSAELAVRT